MCGKIIEIFSSSVVIIGRIFPRFVFGHFSWTTYHSIERHRRYKTRYRTDWMIRTIEEKKVENHPRCACMSKSLSHSFDRPTVLNMIAKISFICFCSPFNSASNPIFAIVIRRSTSEKWGLQWCLLDTFFHVFWYIHIIIHSSLVLFSHQFLRLGNQIIHGSIGLQSLYNMRCKEIRSRIKGMARKSVLWHRWHRSSLVLLSST